MVFSVVFTVTLKAEAQESRFLQAFRELQHQCQKHNPGALSYELHRDESHPLRFCLLGRYVSRDDFEGCHLSSPPLEKLNTLLQKMGVTETSLTRLSNDSIAALIQSVPPTADDLLHGSRVANVAATNATNLRQQKGVLVFCGSCVGAKECYVAEAESLGVYIATRCNLPLVYGGGTVGLMGAVARATKGHGGNVIGVLPQALLPREASKTMIGDLIYITQTMSERKSIMFAHASIVVALPGGLGTFDELFEVMTLLQLSAYRPKIGIVNVNGYFDLFLANLQHMVQEGFVEEEFMGSFLVRPTVEELMQDLMPFEPPLMAASLQWHMRP